MPCISVLVPVYKVEPYLQRCIDSVLAQDFTDWEMILVDDGSPDRCPEICDEAAKKDARIRVVHKENGGLPSARLAGFEQAKGKYLVFLDSDDWLLEHALDTLYREIVEDDFDIVKSRPMRVSSTGIRTLESYSVNEGHLCGCEIYGEAIILEKIHPYLHSGIYKRAVFSSDIFKKISDNHISFCEDWFANVLAIKNVEKVKISQIPTYAYFINSESIVGSNITSPMMNILIENVCGGECRSISSNLYHTLVTKMQINNIRSFFHPEIPFSIDRYRMVKRFVQDNRRCIHENMDSKFLKFIQFLPFYYLYTQIYKYLFLQKRLKGKKRKVLYTEIVNKK